jgi:hypothetical protein
MDASTGSVTAEASRHRLEAIQKAAVRARWAAAPIVATTLLYDVLGSSRVWALGAEVYPFAILASSLTWLAGTVLFLMWLHRAVSNTTLLGSPVSWRPAQAVSSFFIPIIGLFRPYQVVTDVYRASDPSRIADMPSYVPREGAHYRESAVERVATPRWSYPAPIGAWWTLFILRNFVGIAAFPLFGWTGVTLAKAAADIVACGLCLLVMRSINERQRELCRRLDAAEGATRRAVAGAAVAT